MPTKSHALLGGDDPHRKATCHGGEFSVTMDPPQTNDLALNIQASETVWVAKLPEKPSSAPSVTRYMYLAKEQHWRDCAIDEPTRHQCDAPPPPLPAVEFTLRGVVGPTPIVTAPDHFRRRDWMGAMLNWALRASRNFWNLCYYGLPTGDGVATGAIRNRRDVLRAHLSSLPFWSWGGHGLHGSLGLRVCTLNSYARTLKA